MLAGGYGWQLFFYVEVAFAGALLILAFFFVEETAYTRQTAISPSSPNSPRASNASVEKEHIASEHIEVQTLVPPRRTFVQTLKPWSGVDHEVQAFMTAARSFTYLLVPSVLWVVASYGIYIGLGALVFNYTFPILIIQPPYNWAPVSLQVYLTFHHPWSLTSDISH
jgi:Flp pilus assembly protein TadB